MGVWSLGRVLAASALVAGVATSASIAVARDKPRVATDSPRQAHANEVSGAIRTLVAADAGFGGLWVDQAKRTHVAVTPQAIDRIRRLLDARFKGEYVLQSRSVTYRQLEARMARVTREIPALRRAGLDLLEWGPDEIRGTLRVSIRGYSPARAALAHRLLGADVIVERAAAGGGSDTLFGGNAQG